MQTFFYLFLGFLDVIAIFALIFRTFRWPFWEFRLKLTVIGVFISFVSYMNRMVLDIPQFDIAIQFILFIVFFRYVIRVNVYHAIDVTAIGYLTFMSIQLILYYVMKYFQLITLEDATNPVAAMAFFIQVLSEACSFLVAYLFYRFQLGFSFMMRPPHNLYLNRTIDLAKRTKMVFNTIGILTISISVYWLANHERYFLILPALTFLSLAMLIYLSYKRDLQD
ncbi:hypothetical protein ACFQ88_34910 [Paenibacillus sp. NPDC056579]|uniref:hypothetical protein n=1 Tax=Paenibacillus sp. NPDC056579 TaxID=3345871 RepID=UPI0036CEC82D